MNSKKIQILFYIIFVNFLYSQNENININSYDSLSLFEKIYNTNLELIQSKKIKRITIIYNSKNEPKINIFKIQLNSLNNSRIIAQNDSAKYEDFFYPEKVEIVYEAPYFKSKTGCFLQKMKAEKKLTQVLKKFKNAFIVQESINIEELNP